MNKTECRKTAREIIKKLDADYTCFAGNRITEKVLNSEEYRKAETIFIYVSAKGEPDTLKIIDDALNRGKRVAVPLCIDDRNMELHLIKSLHDLKSGMYGIMEPLDHTPLIGLDQIDYSYIPCLAMDRKGNRLGKGKGYYDRFLGNRSFRVSVLCFHKLLFDDLPAEDHDIPIRTIITENEILKVD